MIAFELLGILGPRRETAERGWPKVVDVVWEFQAGEMASALPGLPGNIAPGGSRFKREKRWTSHQQIGSRQPDAFPPTPRTNVTNAAPFFFSSGTGTEGRYERICDDGMTSPSVSDRDREGTCRVLPGPGGYRLAPSLARELCDPRSNDAIASERELSRSAYVCGRSRSGYPVGVEDLEVDQRFPERPKYLRIRAPARGRGLPPRA